MYMYSYTQHSQSKPSYTKCKHIFQYIHIPVYEHCNMQVALLPTNAMRACTASIIEIERNTQQTPGAEYTAHVKYMSREEWRQEVFTHAHTQTHTYTHTHTNKHTYTRTHTHAQTQTQDTQTRTHTHSGVYRTR